MFILAAHWFRIFLHLENSIIQNLKKVKTGNIKSRVDKNSVCIRLSGEEKGKVNSAHHQSADMPGYGLVANAMSPDGIIEGMERKDPEGKSLSDVSTVAS